MSGNADGEKGRRFPETRKIRCGARDPAVVRTEEETMQYQLNTSNYHDFGVYEQNKLPGRSYFIPYSSRREAEERRCEYSRRSSVERLSRPRRAP